MLYLLYLVYLTDPLLSNRTTCLLESTPIERVTWCNNRLIIN